VPTPFLRLRPWSCCEASRRVRFTGRTVEAVMVRSPAELGGCIPLTGGFLADSNGDGEAVADGAPFVWMLEGIGRLALFAILGMGGITGAMMRGC
jgi:hypothetical protein